MIVRGTLETVALRLSPGADVRRELEQIAKKEAIGAGFILGAVGSLSKVCLRFAGEETPAELPGKHEILTLSGTLGEDAVHLHMSVANSRGECRGGHVVYGCEVYTTLELAIGLIPEVRFKRVWDEGTGFKELGVFPISEPPV